MTQSLDSNEHLNEEALVIPCDCHVCFKPGNNKACLVTIPFFKELIINCFKCEFCGFKEVDIKGGGGISEKAKKITLKVKTIKDLNRDLFKVNNS